MARLKFAYAHKKWSVEDWSKVLWSDESKYNLVFSDGIWYIRRRKNERFNVRYQVPTIKHGGGHVMVWGCFSRNGVGPLVQINGTMTAETYNAIITESMISFSHENMGNDWIFQHDNDPKHTSKLVKETLQRNNISVLQWPSQSPDINPIEHLLEELDRAVRFKKYKNKSVFFGALQETLAQLPMEKLNALVDSMLRRCAAAIAANGYPTKY